MAPIIALVSEVWKKFKKFSLFMTGRGQLATAIQINWRASTICHDTRVIAKEQRTRRRKDGEGSVEPRAHFVLKLSPIDQSKLNEALGSYIQAFVFYPVQGSTSLYAPGGILLGSYIPTTSPARSRHPEHEKGSIATLYAAKEVARVSSRDLAADCNAES